MKILPLILLATIVMMGCRVKPTVDNLLSKNSTTRELARAEIAQLADNERVALGEALLPVLQVDDSRVIGWASEALVKMGEPIIPLIMKQFQSSDPYVRLSAAQILGQMGISSDSVVSGLEKMTKDPHPLVQEMARDALSKIKHT